MHNTIIKLRHNKPLEPAAALSSRRLLLFAVYTSGSTQTARRARGFHPAQRLAAQRRVSWTKKMPIILAILIFVLGCSHKPNQNKNIRTNSINYNDTIVVSKVEIPESASIRFIYSDFILKFNINDFKNSSLENEGLKYTSNYKSGLIYFDLLNHIQKSNDKSIILRDSMVSVGYEPIISLVRKGQFEIFKNQTKIDSIKIIKENIQDQNIRPVVSGSSGYSLKDMKNTRLIFYAEDIWIQ